VLQLPLLKSLFFGGVMGSFDWFITKKKTHIMDTPHNKIII
jgi:hypothetical protein